MKLFPINDQRHTKWPLIPSFLGQDLSAWIRLRFLSHRRCLTIFFSFFILLMNHEGKSRAPQCRNLLGAPMGWIGIIEASKGIETRSNLKPTVSSLTSSGRILKWSLRAPASTAAALESGIVATLNPTSHWPCQQWSQLLPGWVDDWYFLARAQANLKATILAILLDNGKLQSASDTWWMIAYASRNLRHRVVVRHFSGY